MLFKALNVSMRSENLNLSVIWNALTSEALTTSWPGPVSPGYCHGLLRGVYAGRGAKTLVLNHPLGPGLEIWGSPVTTMPPNCMNRPDRQVATGVRFQPPTSASRMRGAEARKDRPFPNGSSHTPARERRWREAPPSIHEYCCA